MPWVFFKANMDHRVSRFVVRAYKAGNAYLVSQRAADEAIAKGKGEIMERKPK